MIKKLFKPFQTIKSRALYFYCMDQSSQKPEQLKGKHPQKLHKDRNHQQLIEENGNMYFLEGKAKILTKKVTQLEAKKIQEEEVFYNPVQIFNRDITVLVISTFAKMLKEQQGEKFKGIRILDALSASGLRTIRFAQEIDKSLISEIYANDISQASLSLIKENIQQNNLDQEKIKLNHMDANLLLCNSAFQVNNTPYFDVIDLDPYGSVCPFLDSAMMACNNDGNKPTLLCVTCTDSRVLCGPDQQKCFSLYGTARTKMTSYAENGIRTLLYTISTASGKLNKSMTPLIAIYGEFYLRVFVLIQKNRNECLSLISQIGNVFYCPQCTSFWNYAYGQQEGSDEKKQFKISKKQFLSQCINCEAKLRLNGPVWLDKLNDQDFIIRMQDELKFHENSFQTYNKIIGKLEGILEQIKFEKFPYSYNFGWICTFLKSQNLSKKDIYSGFQSLGYEVCQSYMQSELYKCNAPPEVVIDIIKAFVKGQLTIYIIQKKSKTKEDTYLKNILEGTYPYKVLTSPVVYNPDFTVKPQSLSQIKKFYPNPEKNWGPKQRAVEKKIIDQQLEQVKTDMVVDEEVDEIKKKQKM